MTKGKNQYVNPRKNGGWEVKGEGNTRATAVTETKAEALKIGRDIARNQHSELVIKGRDGRIQDKDSYGNDPHPPIDRKH